MRIDEIQCKILTKIYRDLKSLHGALPIPSFLFCAKQQKTQAGQPAFRTVQQQAP
jgi:hypothetical protein